MAATYPAGLTRNEGETLSVSSTLASLGLFPQTHQLILYNPAVDFRLHFNPTIADIVFFDASASAGSRFKRDGSSGEGKLTSDLTDRDTNTGSGTLLDSTTVATDFLYIGLYRPVSGLRITVKSGNSASNSLKGEYRKNDNTWADLSVSDGTVSGGAALGTTGSVTWSAVTDWKSDGLQSILQDLTDPGATNDAPNRNLFWMRLSTTTAGLDADTEISEIWTLNQDTNRGYYRAGQEYIFSIDRRAVGAFEVALASGSDTMQVTHVRVVQ